MPANLIHAPNNRPLSIRLGEVEQAVLHALDARGVKVGQRVPFSELETAMGPHGYGIKWVRRAVDSLIAKGLLEAERTMLRRPDETLIPPPRRQRVRPASRGRNRMQNL